MRARGEQGVAVVLGLVAIALLMTVAVLGAGVASLVVTHRKAQAAADLAALAAASDLQAGRDGCVAARQIAEGNGALVQGCSVDGDEVTVLVAIATPPMLGKREVRARARAGPSAGSDRR